jgi:hypothetical protein
LQVTAGLLARKTGKKRHETNPRDKATSQESAKARGTKNYVVNRGSIFIERNERKTERQEAV